MPSNDSAEVQLGAIVKQTKDYRVVVATLQWEGSVKGDAGYRIINKVTGVCEGEGSILAVGMQYADKLQAALDEYYEPPVQRRRRPNDDDDIVLN